MVPMEVFVASAKAPRGLVMCSGGLEREKGISELKFGPNHDENEKGEHLWSWRSTTKLPGTFVAAIGLRNGELEVAVHVRANRE